MTRLPVPGGDDGQWGSLLNDFLSVAHNNDGTLKSGVQSVAGKTGTVTLAPTDVGLANVTNDTQVKVSDVDADGALAANSDGKIPTQKAVKTYVDARTNSNQAIIMAIAL